ncbi:MAG: hypothetical protein LBV50_13005 [Novosphingobium sp.]|jgi:hypothetical protein|nr:hypothetical protein [Novosphingobium sp.]
MTGTALITGARAPVAQDLARAFRTAGYRVHLADSAPGYAARAMRPPFPVHRLPPPRSAFPAFRKAMRRLIATTGPTHIVPSCEEVFWLAEAAARDGYADRLFAPGLPLLTHLHSKADFVRFAAGIGITVPETHILDTPFIPERLPLPLGRLVLKPEFSRFATHTMIAPTPARAARVRPSPAFRWVAQQRIDGEEICSWSALHQGRIAAFAAYRPRWRQGRAAAFQIEAADVPQVREITARIGAATGMTGHLSLDIIVDAAGTAYPIECNPRAVSGLHLFDAGADLARAVLEGVPCSEPRPGTLRHMGPAMALLGLPAALASGRLGALRADWRASRDVIDREGSFHVTLACLADAAGFALQALRSKRSPAGATTADIEWDGEAIP